MNRALLVVLVAFLPMAVEARRSRRHERALRAAGAVEPANDVYPLMQVAYPLCFAAIAIEGWTRATPPGASLTAGLLVFTAAKGLKYWAIATLGARWTFRVLVPRGAPRITSGPYRWLRHPNYIGVAGELAGAALMAHAPIAGVLSMLTFGALMLERISIEERAMDLS